MAEAEQTKRALAAAVKELMLRQPFDKISVSRICETCGIRRKSFYYHFRDKYDLVNWIFDVEFLAAVAADPPADSWGFLMELSAYLYANRDFYRRALAIQGQNAFGEHFRDRMVPLIEGQLQKILTGQENTEFYINFFADAILCATARWLMDKSCMPPEEFLRLLRACIEQTATKVYQDIRP